MQHYAIIQYEIKEVDGEYIYIYICVYVFIYIHVYVYIYIYENIVFANITK